MATMASLCGGTAHLSPLLRKARALGLETPDSLLRLAILRGCTHYVPADYNPLEVTDPGEERFGNEELGVALISGAQEYEPQRMRCAAQLLSGKGLNVETLSRLALMERCEDALAYIAKQGSQWDVEGKAFWTKLSSLLPKSLLEASEVWPHPSRFMLQPGYRRGGAMHTPVWLRPRTEGIAV
jgi:hypothetical protein